MTEPADGGRWELGIVATARSGGLDARAEGPVVRGEPEPEGGGMLEAKLAATRIGCGPVAWSLDCFRAGVLVRPDGFGGGADVIATGLEVGTRDLGASIGLSFGVGLELDLPFDGDFSVAFGSWRFEGRTRGLPRLLEDVWTRVSDALSRLFGDR